MEEAEAKEEFPPCVGFGRAVEEGGVTEWVSEVGAQQIGSETFRRLVGHLHSVLQDTDWKLFTWVTGQPQPEIWRQREPWRDTVEGCREKHLE